MNINVGKWSAVLVSLVAMASVHRPWVCGNGVREAKPRTAVASGHGQCGAAWNHAIAQGVPSWMGEKIATH